MLPLAIFVLLIIRCQTAELFTHGTAAGDAVLRCGDHKSCSTGFMTTAPIYMFKQIFTKVNIYSNGYVTMNTPFDGRQPKKRFQSMFDSAKMAVARDKGFALIAPLWTDNDARYGSIFYQVYDSTKGAQSSTASTVLKRAADAMTSYTSTSDNALWVLVVTWKDMRPRMWYSPLLDMPNTFQLVLLQDPMKWLTSTLFIYGETGWDTTLSVRGNIAGYYVVGAQINTYAGPLSFRAHGLELASVTGNKNKTGESFFKLSDQRSDPNYDHQCRAWYNSEVVSFKHTQPCPCNVAMVSADARWRPDGVVYPDNKTCFYERMPSETSSQSCCYASAGYLLTRLDGSAGPTFRYHPRHYNHRKNDWEPHYWCCVMSHNCDKFYAQRPIDTCITYKAPSIGWMLGDPHVATLDGVRYTFNGLGEYTLVSTKDDVFMLQARTTKARNTDGSDVKAAVVSAVVAKGRDTDSIQVELNTTAAGLTVVVNYGFHTDWYTESKIGDEKVFDGFVISKEAETSLIVAFSNGVVLTVTAVEGRLDLSVLVPDDLKGPHTRGLFGVFDGDSQNDLTPRRTDGSSGIPLNTTSSSDRSIHNNFAETWRTPKNYRLFIYQIGTSVLTYDITGFHPTFSDEFLSDYLTSLASDERAQYALTCSQDRECLFDLALTKDIRFATSTHVENTQHGAMRETLNNVSPVVNVPRELNVTIGDLIQFTVHAADTVDVRIVSAMPANSVFDWYTRVFTWTPSDKSPVAIRFVGEDEHGGLSAEAHVVVNLCGCSEHGVCLFDKLAYGQYYASAFRVVACQCDIGWMGEFCDVDFDGCADNPCTAGTTCTDLHQAEHAQSGKAFTCSECPAGYEQIYGICVDVNECLSNSKNTCEQRCINVLKSDSASGFRCGCVAGFILGQNDNTCRNIDECKGPTSLCSHRCTDLVGSYMCQCNANYALDDDQYTCVQNGDDHCACHPCQNGGLCQNYVKDYKCVCPTGYTGAVCEQETSPCRSSPCINGATCQNISTNYTCRCLSGFFGSQCEFEVDECLSDPCFNGGSCIDERGRYSCSCTRIYTGENCQLLSNPCHSNPCSNGATCRQTSDRSFSCDCPRGYSGSTCEHDEKVQHVIMFRILNMVYIPDLERRSNIAYNVLADDLTKTIENIYANSKNIGAHFIGVEGIAFSEGSVVVKCTLSLNEQTPPVVLKDILDGAITEGKFQSYYEISSNLNITKEPEMSTRSNNGVFLSTRIQIFIGCGAAVVVSVAMILVYLCVLRLKRKGAVEDTADMTEPGSHSDGNIYEELAT